ncbi:NlpC/P60 family protein [Parvularcula maris]|uniref:NlpC/P60 family protein n=1 Tax=Parvularcula maris TaxID=2965077 RepID=A0A9X2RGV8_9PROT|nr:NlpC/P60 family protein [Parvularcula maris]MCQ8184244.1 NlpC/P60 family protein [Parvularcula maris]
MTAVQRCEEAALLRARIIAEAISWIGTPYRHQASQKGHGTDCLGLVRGVYRHIHGHEPEVPTPYGRRGGRDEVLLEAAKRHLRRVAEPQPGDVLLFRMRRTQAVRHCGILIAPDRFVHAHDGQSVTGAPLIGFWASRVAAAFSFPETP